MRQSSPYPTSEARVAGTGIPNNSAAPSVGSAACQAQSPFASTAGTGLFNTLGANAGGLGAAPLLMLESDPADTTAASSMNNAINTRLGAASVSFTTVNLDNAGHTPTHALNLYMAAWVAEATNHLGWMVTNGWS